MLISFQGVRQAITYIAKDGYVRRTAKVVADILACSAAVFVSYLIRFPLSEVAGQIASDTHFLVLLVGLQMIAFSVFDSYSAMWRYSGLSSLNRLLIVSSLSVAVVILVSYALRIPGLPRSIAVLDWFLVISFCGAVRLSRRIVHSLLSTKSRPNLDVRRVLIYGAGNAGENLLRSIEMAADIRIHVVGFIDDNPSKHGQRIHHKPVLGGSDRIGALLKRYDVREIYVAIPSLGGLELRRLFETIRNQSGEAIRVHTLPSIRHLAHGRVSIEQVRKLEIGDLLRREPVRLDHVPVKRLLADQSVMIVGGGGSIGRELCRQIAQLHPARLAIVDACEFFVYEVHAQLAESFPDLQIDPVVANAGNKSIMRQVFMRYRPDYVFHAAAYKHVPLMEANPLSAVDNNLKCTLTLCELCGFTGVKRFILVSTDKAVRPTSMMGKTKRICELIVLGCNQMSSTQFMAVRFGNVLGSSGSVVPKFAQQIMNGGPVTVTHPDVTRYFMLIPEAVELVLQSAAIGERGCIYVLEMGEPIRIAELARDMIRLSEADLNDELEIKFTGLRPGEKLHESLYLEGKEAATHVPNLMVLKPKLIAGQAYIQEVYQFLEHCGELDRAALTDAVNALIPENEQPETQPSMTPSTSQIRTLADSVENRTTVTT